VRDHVKQPLPRGSGVRASSEGEEGELSVCKTDCIRMVSTMKGGRVPIPGKSQVSRAVTWSTSGGESQRKHSDEVSGIGDFESGRFGGFS